MVKLRLKSFVNCVFSTIAVSHVWQTAEAYTMRELYDRALVYSESVQSATLDEEIIESEKNRLATVSKPRVTLSADGAYRVNKYDRRVWGDDRTAGLRTEFRQALADGGTTRSAMSVADANIEAFHWDIKTQEQELYLRVASLFYEWIAQSEDIKNLEETLKILESRVKDLSDRERIGRSRNAEVFSARTQIELTRGMIAQSRTNRNAAEEELSWLTKVQMPLKLDDVLDLQKIQTKKIDANTSESSFALPTVQAAKARVLAAERSIELTRSDLEPRLDFIAAHQWTYLDPIKQGYHDFSVGLGLTWLLYDSGQVNAAVTTSRLKKARASVAMELADREGNLRLEMASRRLKDSFVQIRSYRAALDVVESTLSEQRKEYDSGLITNLELLTTLDQRLQIRRNLDLALNRAKFVYVQTEVYSGAWLSKNKQPNTAPDKLSK